MSDSSKPSSSEEEKRITEAPDQPADLAAAVKMRSGNISEIPEKKLTQRLKSMGSDVGQSVAKLVRNETQLNKDILLGAIEKVKDGLEAGIDRKRAKELLPRTALLMCVLILVSTGVIDEADDVRNFRQAYDLIVSNMELLMGYLNKDFIKQVMKELSDGKKMFTTSDKPKI